MTPAVKALRAGLPAPQAGVSRALSLHQGPDLGPIGCPAVAAPPLHPNRPAVPDLPRLFLRKRLTSSP